MFTVFDINSSVEFAQKGVGVGWVGDRVGARQQK